ncbi:hypothetical protein MSAN_01109400 [Mycena sanguinolenta]|uniref:Uncharacterized protein n=1 Tax=Mycena sanguinolenta TaxID=230812 RepID=A0A8H7D7Q1_9AGAR|nr:hypothetical protein MSAN_01109400 [Mycena sanguinolenta]
MLFKALASIFALSAFVSVNASPTSSDDVCLKICSPVEMACADGWHSETVGDHCSTCCLNQEIPVKPTDKKGVCWANCFEYTPKCPPDWYPMGGDDCWTCCHLVDDDLVSPAQSAFRMCRDM